MASVLSDNEDEDINIDEMAKQALEAFEKADFEKYYEIHDTLKNFEQMKFVQKEKQLEQGREINLKGDKKNDELGNSQSLTLIYSWFFNRRKEEINASD